ncbi:MAG: galactose ABC transporter substrate-binding protein [Eubacteriales bacterium]|nr:galactose ABC transporter substrate-binding protein [Eubacteriales bacterium]
MKRFLAAGLATTMAFSLAACGGDKTPAAGGDGGDSGAAKNDLAVGVMYYNYADTYIATVRGVLSSKLDELGIKHDDQDGNNNQTTQTEQVQNAVTMGTQMLIVNLVNTASDDAANGIIDKAKTGDLPILFFNREVSDAVVKGYDKAAFVGTNAPEAGHMQGEMIGDYLLENYDKYDLNGDGKITYVLFKGEQGNAEAEARSQYAVEDANAKLVAAGKPELEFYDAKNDAKYLVDQKGAWSSAAAQEYMTTILSEYNDANNNMVELVICNNDGMAEGAITALNTSGYNDGGEKAVPVFGVDATPAAVSLIADKKMAGTIKQDAEGMAQCIADMTSNVAAGKDMMDGIADKYRVDEGVNKVRIPYQIYLGE